MAVFTPAKSGYRYAMLFKAQDTAAFQQSHAEFFDHCKGNFKMMVYDNMRVAVNGSSIPGGYYRLTKPTEDLQLILNAFGIHADLRLPTISELGQLKYSFDKAAVMRP